MSQLPRDDRVSVAGGKTTKRRSGARTLSSRVFPRLAVLLAAFALFAQLMALPYHHAEARQDPASVAAALRATFGDSAILCVATDDDMSSTSPERRQGHCDDGCPLCQFAAQAVALVAPTPSLPARVDVAAAPFTARADFDGKKPSPTGFAQPRAPPLEV
jgi:hypothetical protein